MFHLLLEISCLFFFCKGQRLVGCGEFPQVAIFKAATQGTCDGYPSIHGHCHAHRNDLHWHGVILKNFLKNGFVYLFICFLPFVSLHLLSFMLFPGAQLKIPTRVTCFSLRWLSVTYGAIMWTWSEPLTKARETWSKEVFFFNVSKFKDVRVFCAGEKSYHWDGRQDYTIEIKWRSSFERGWLMAPRFSDSS